jgi:hypothetical protein
VPFTIKLTGFGIDPTEPGDTIGLIPFNGGTCPPPSSYSSVRSGIPTTNPSTATSSSTLSYGTFSVATPGKYKICFLKRGGTVYQMFPNVGIDIPGRRATIPIYSYRT